MDSLLVLLFGAGGISLIFFGVRLRRGYHKLAYFGPSVRLYSTAWMVIPAGIMSLMWATGFLMGLFSVNKISAAIGIILIGGGIAVVFVGFILSLFQPSFMKPGWLKWLEIEYKEIMPLMKKEAREMGYKQWEEQVSTQEGLEQWADSVAQKYGYK